uniref:Uncharacterized protein n=1 Tax=Pyramimonas orientalis virus TaxID=455367 RepID=A0A7M3UP38_POV01|nr:hypothetical protein HWQ62_00362 [Pyramimonas orientalis virus]
MKSFEEGRYNKIIQLKIVYDEQIENLENSEQN